MASWTRETVQAALQERGWLASSHEIEHGVQFVLADETRVNWFNTGRVSVQGKASEVKMQAQGLFGSNPPTKTSLGKATIVSSGSVPAVGPTRVFIVYGHDVDSREQLELLLRRLKLEPIVLQNLPPAGDTIIEKLEELTDADFACVLVTPDDEGRKRGEEQVALKPRARQNVVLELGMVLARLGRKRVAILLKGKDIEKPSDIDGLLYISFEKNVSEIKNVLAANLQEAGFTIQVKDLLA